MPDGCTNCLSNNATFWKSVCFPNCTAYGTTFRAADKTSEWSTNRSSVEYAVRAAIYLPDCPADREAHDCAV